MKLKNKALLVSGGIYYRILVLSSNLLYLKVIRSLFCFFDSGCISDFDLVLLRLGPSTYLVITFSVLAT